VAGTGVVGLAVGAWRADLLALLALAHALVLVCGMALPNQSFFIRTYLPALPAVCIGFGLALGAAAERLEAWPPHGRAIRAALAAALFGLVVPTAAWQSWQVFRSGHDARTRALDWIAMRARSPVTVALTATVAGPDAIGSHPTIRDYLRRPDVRFLPDVTRADQATASGADYVLVASSRTPYHGTGVYRQRWPFRGCAGYHQVAAFECNPYEHRLGISPMWDGRVSAIVLARDHAR
jgi:hypothetical protein